MAKKTGTKKTTSTKKTGGKKSGGMTAMSTSTNGRRGMSGTTKIRG